MGRSLLTLARTCGVDAGSAQRIALCVATDAWMGADLPVCRAMSAAAVVLRAASARAVFPVQRGERKHARLRPPTMVEREERLRLRLQKEAFRGAVLEGDERGGVIVVDLVESGSALGSGMPSSL